MDGDFVTVLIPVDSRTLAGLNAKASKQGMKPGELALRLLWDSKKKPELLNMRTGRQPPQAAGEVEVSFPSLHLEALSYRAKISGASSVEAFLSALLERKVSRIL